MCAKREHTNARANRDLLKQQHQFLLVTAASTSRPDQTLACSASALNQK